MSRCFAHLKAKQGMIFYVAPDMAGTDIFPPHGEVAAEMPVQKAPEQVEQQRSQEYQGEGQMPARSEEHTSELQSLMRISYAVFCLKKKKTQFHRHKT